MESATDWVPILGHRIPTLPILKTRREFLARTGGYIYGFWSKPLRELAVSAAETASYGKLSLDLDIRGKSATSAHERLQFNEIKVGECSEVLRFVNIPQNSESSPFVIKINNVMWDYDCTFDPVGTANCNTQPLKSVWNNHCWEIELHVATDITHDIPR